MGMNDDLSAQTSPNARPTPVWDRVASIVILVFVPLVAITSSFFAFVSVMGQSVCGPDECDTGVINAGGFLAGFAPWLVCIGGVVLFIVAMIRGRRAFWFAISTLIVAVALGAIGIAMIFGTITGRG